METGSETFLGRDITIPVWLVHGRLGRSLSLGEIGVAEVDIDEPLGFPRGGPADDVPGL
jgi:hypothetical protein